jgi:predicted nucleic acid-binding protein
VIPHWVDTNVFIEANDGPYSFALAPSFWRHIEKMLANGSIRSSEMVYKEIIGYGDDLSKWFKQNKQTGLYAPLTQSVQDHFGKIANHVYGRYDAANSSEFLSAADGWIIAHALDTGGIVVSQESKHYPNANKARIPDVCKQFSVSCINLYEMLQQQGASF